MARRAAWTIYAARRDRLFAGRLAAAVGCGRRRRADSPRAGQPQLGFDDMTGIVDAALAGFGLAWLPAWLLARFARTGELVTVMEHCFRPTQEIHLVWPKSRYLPLKTRCAIDALVAQIPPMIGAPAAGAPGSQDA